MTFIARDGYLFDEHDGKNQKYATSYELVWDFELIEDQTIDIDSIEEYQIPAHVPITALEEKIIDLINEDRKTIKHLNKEIQSIKEK